MIDPQSKYLHAVLNNILVMCGKTCFVQIGNISLKKVKTFGGIAF